MFNRPSCDPIKGGIVLMLLIGLTGTVFATDTWSPEDEEHFLSDDLHKGAQLAVARVMFLPEGGSVERAMLVAITDGEDKVRIYSFDEGSLQLQLEDEVTIDVTGISTPVAWTPTFMDLDIDQGGDESCLVIPTLHHSTDEGSISIVRLTERDNSDELEILNDCLATRTGTNWSVYHVAELHSTAEHEYTISTEYGDDPPPSHDNDIIMCASFDGSSNEFVEEDTLHIPAFYYGARGVAPWARAWVTRIQDFQYGSVFSKTLCYTTTHNGGILIWDPTLDPPEIVSRIAAYQHGGWEYSSEIGGELGDVHRAAVLEGSSSTIANLDNALVSSRLLFFSNNTMGLVVCDISKPDAPQFVWQWDCDTRVREDSAADQDWDWHGSGNMDDDTIDNQAAAGEHPGETFGIRLATDDEASPPVIHVYLAGGEDGLRLFDLSEFLDPFGVGSYGDGSNYDDFEIDIYDDYRVDSSYLQAFDLQAFTVDGDTYVFTSWRQSRTGQGYIGLTVHLDEDVVCD